MAQKNKWQACRRWEVRTHVIKFLFWKISVECGENELFTAIHRVHSKKMEAKRGKFVFIAFHRFFTKIQPGFDTDKNIHF